MPLLGLGKRPLNPREATRGKASGLSVLLRQEVETSGRKRGARAIDADRAAWASPIDATGKRFRLASTTCVPGISFPGECALRLSGISR